MGVPFRRRGRPGVIFDTARFFERAGLTALFKMLDSSP